MPTDTQRQRTQRSDQSLSPSRRAFLKKSAAAGAGAAALYARNEDIVLEIVYRRLPAPVQRYLVLVIYVAIIVALAVVLDHTFTLIEVQWNLPTPALRVPQAVFAVPVAIASVSIILTSLVECWACILWIGKGNRPPVWPQSGTETVPNQT